MVARLFRCAVLVLVGCALGLAWNNWSGRGFALTDNALIQPGDQTVDAATAKAKLDKGQTLFLDARAQPFYEMGHIPGALVLPEPEFDAAFAKLEPTLRRSLDIVVYCAGFGCEASHVVARRLKEKNVQASILQDGWPAWQDAKYPINKGPKP